MRNIIHTFIFQLIDYRNQISKCPSFPRVYVCILIDLPGHAKVDCEGWSSKDVKSWAVNNLLKRILRHTFIYALPILFITYLFCVSSLASRWYMEHQGAELFTANTACIWYHSRHISINVNWQWQFSRVRNMYSTSNTSKLRINHSSLRLARST